MTIQQQTLIIPTFGRGMVDITKDVAEFVKQGKVVTGLCHIFLHHTSASLVISENADPLVQSDLEKFFSTLIPDGNPLFKHIDEGPDDMPSHVRSILTQTFLTIPITGHYLGLGTWQGIYLWEHRLAKHQRRVTITLQG